MKQVILSLLLCLCGLSAKAQDMATLFTAMPDQYIPQLQDAWRKDLIDLYQSDKEARLQNTMNGFSVLKKLTPDYLLLQSTERSTVELKRLPLVNNTFIICMVSTVNGPVPDSRVAFYTTDWQPLPASDLLTPVTPDWFIKADADRNSEAFLLAMAPLDIELMQYNLSPDAFTLSATYTTPQYLSKQDRAGVTSYLKDTPKVYTWERSHFE